MKPQSSLIDPPIPQQAYPPCPRCTSKAVQRAGKEESVHLGWLPRYRCKWCLNVYVDEAHPLPPRWDRPPLLFTLRQYPTVGGKLKVLGVLSYRWLRWLFKG